MLRDPVFVKAMMDAMLDAPPLIDRPALLRKLRRPKFRVIREVHAARARKLRRRGEYVHFMRWEYGHCIYGWSGPTPDSFTFRIHPAHDRNAKPPALRRNVQQSEK